MAQIEITNYTKTTRTVEVTFPVYIRDLRSYKEGEHYDEYTMLTEDGRSVAIIEDIDEEGCTYEIITGKTDVARGIGHVYDESRRELKEGEGCAFSTKEEFEAKLGAALVAMRALCPQVQS